MRSRYANKHKCEGAIRKIMNVDCLSYAPTSSGRTEKYGAVFKKNCVARRNLTLSYIVIYRSTFAFKEL